jgi:glycosyltransferase involved in cell wall biosynthesis
MDRLRILYLFVSLPVGGAENLLISILRQLDSSRYEAAVCTLGERGVLANLVTSMGIPLFELGMFELRGGRTRTKHALIDLMRRERIHLVHSHLYHANYLGRLAARQLKIPCVISIQNTYSNPKIHRRIINWWLSRRHTAAIIVGSKEIAQDVVRHDHVRPDLIELIPNGIDLSRSESSLTKGEARDLLCLGHDTFVVGTVGRLEQQKGHRFLLESIKILRTKGFNVALLLIGEGREERPLREQAKRLNLDTNVHFLGTRDDLGDLFRAMDLFVMPSLWEGLSLAMLSAAAAGIAVIATDVGGVNEVLGKNERGFSVQPMDSEGLADQIAWCFAHPEATSAIAKLGKEHVIANYSDKAMVSRIESTYQRVAKLNPSPV